MHLIGNGSHGGFFDGAASTGALYASVANSEASGGVEGISALTVSGKAVSLVTLIGSRIFNNNFFGIVADGPGATVAASQTTVFANNVGLQTLDGGVLESYGDNNIGLNGTDGTFTASTLTKK